MWRLRVLITAVAVSCRTGAPDPVPAAPAVATTEAAPAPKAPEVAPAKVAPLPIGERLDPVTWQRVWPAPGEERGAPERPTVLFFWSPSSPLSREELVSFDRWVGEVRLLERANVLAVAGIRAEGLGPDDVRDVAALLELRAVPVVVDPELATSRRLGVQFSPEIVALAPDGALLGRQVRSLDHGRLTSPEVAGPMDAREWLLAVAEKGTGPSLPRTFPWYPADAVVGHRVPDVSVARFGADGPAATVPLRSLLSGKRPAALFFFSSTCKHCQVDVPQIVALEREHPDAWDVVGITSIKSPQHRAATAKYLEQQDVSFPVLEDDGALNDLLRVTSTPTTLYVADNGTIGAASYYQHQDLAADWAKTATALAKTAPGTPFAEPRGWAFPLGLTGPDGSTLQLADLEGTPIALHFWATWCQPCKAELPALLARRAALEERGRLVLVSLDRDPHAIDRFRAQSGLTFDTWTSPRGGVADRLDLARSLPRTYVLDGHGRLQQVLRGTYEWSDDTKLARVLDQMRR
jgi:thiol-disulfide isomerase/thioredoxin